MSLSKKFFAAFVSLIIAIAFPLSVFVTNVKAADSGYTVNGYGKTGVVKDPDGNPIAEYGFCLDVTLGTPHDSSYERILMSESIYDDDTRTLLLSMMYNMDGLHDYVTELGNTSDVCRNYVNNYYSNEGINYFYQYLVWAIAYPYSDGMNVDNNGEYVGSYYYNRRVAGCGGYSSDPYNDPASYYNQFLVPVYNWLRANAPSDDVDCYIYNPTSEHIQPILGGAFTKATTTTTTTTETGAPSSESSQTTPGSSESTESSLPTESSISTESSESSVTSESAETTMSSDTSVESSSQDTTDTSATSESSEPVLTSSDTTVTESSVPSETSDTSSESSGTSATVSSESTESSAATSVLSASRHQDTSAAPSDNTSNTSTNNAVTSADNSVIATGEGASGHAVTSVMLVLTSIGIFASIMYINYKKGTSGN
ncbi:MAG: hypothetical protein J5685_05060 [Clostridiales bacterium]|nr:hypothetical protein [Clostridiales bacterium]